MTSGKERYILAALYKYYDECILKNERKENNKIDNMVYIPYTNLKEPNLPGRIHMTKFEVIAYETENGDNPVEKFLDKLNPKMRAKIFGMLVILQEKGNQLREPYSKHVEDGIFELRCKFGSDITRVMYFFFDRGKIILINGFVKKTQKTPVAEIQLAKARRADYMERMKKL